jgi:hypothetical protein
LQRYLSFHAILIFVELDVEDFPFANTDAGMTALVGLVAVMAAEVLHGASSIDSNFIDGKETEALACKQLRV